MKKYLVAIFAVILAVSATAFTAPQNFDGEVYYWYDMSGNLLSPVPTEKSPNGCDEGTHACARGFINQTSQPLVDPPDEIGKEFIR